MRRVVLLAFLLVVACSAAPPLPVTPAPSPTSTATSIPLGAPRTSIVPVARTPTIQPSASPTSVAAAVATVRPIATSPPPGHTYYLSSAGNATNYYCDTDPAWKALSPNNLRRYSSAADALAAFPGRQLHQPC